MHFGRGRGQVLSPPPSFLSIWSTPPLVSMGSLDQPMHIHVAVGRYAFGGGGEDRYRSYPPPTSSSPFGPTHLLFLWGSWTNPCIFMPAWEDMHSGMRGTFFYPPTSSSSSSIRLPPSHSLIGPPSFLDGDPCIYMSLSVEDMHRASAKRHIGSPPPPILSITSAQPLISLGLLDQPHACAYLHIG